MWDEISIYSKLDSPLYGALVHAVEIAGLTVQSDISAARVYGIFHSIECTYVSAARLNVSPVQELALHDWPNDEDSLFEFVKMRRLTDGVFRPRELIDELEYSRRQFYRRIEACTRIVDAFCISIELKDKCWCTVTFIRCNTSPAFDDRDMDLVERLKPSLARIIATGFHKEVSLRPASQQKPNQQQYDGDPLPVHLAKLSKTERQVLSYLRSNMTERQIAHELNRSPHTIHVHVKSIYRKLDISSRKQLMEIFNPNPEEQQG